jgi:hypothetical protein
MAATLPVTFTYPNAEVLHLQHVTDVISELWFFTELRLRSFGDAIVNLVALELTSSPQVGRRLSASQ